MVRGESVTSGTSTTSDQQDSNVNHRTSPGNAFDRTSEKRIIDKAQAKDISFL